MKYIGYLSGVMLILCGIPEIYVGLKSGVVGASRGLLYLWMVGEILGLIYSISLKNKPLMMNYGVNSLIVSIIIAIKEGII
jgi:hypothetical protein